MKREDYIRVSSILSLFKDFSHVPKDKLEAKALLGTRVHEAIARHYRQGFFPLRDLERPYFESFLKWQEVEMHPLPILVEERFYDDKKCITGQIDMLCPAEDYCYLVDFKCTAQADPKLWALQGAFYYGLVKLRGNEFPPIANEVVFVQLKPNRKPTWHSYTITDELVQLAEEAWDLYTFINGISINKKGTEKSLNILEK